MSFFNFFKKKQPQTLPQAVFADLPALNAWGVFFQQGGFYLYSRYAGLPGEVSKCIYIKSYPELPQLERMLFGDWIYIAFNGVFLQRWDAHDGSTTTLLFVEIESCTVKEVKTGIAGYNWSAYTQEETLVVTLKNLTNEIVIITADDLK